MGIFPWSGDDSHGWEPFPPISSPRRTPIRRTLLSLALLLLLPLPIALVVPATTTAQGFEERTVSPRCEAAMDWAAGSQARCLLNAKARAARHRERYVEKTSKREAQCRGKFDETVSRGVASFQEENCTSWIPQMEERIASFAAAMASEAGGTPALELLFVQADCPPSLRTHQPLKLWHTH